MEDDCLDDIYAAVTTAPDYEVTLHPDMVGDGRSWVGAGGAMAGRCVVDDPHARAGNARKIFDEDCKRAKGDREELATVLEGWARAIREYSA